MKIKKISKKEGIYNKNLRLKAALAALLVSTSMPLLSSCSKQEKDNIIYSQPITGFNTELCNSKLERLTHIKNYVNKDHWGKYIRYDYYLDIDKKNFDTIFDQYEKDGISSLSPSASFVHLIDESTITDVLKINDGKTAVPTGTFRQFSDIIIWPESLKNENVPYSCINYEMTTKKFITMNNTKTLYYIDFKMMFNDNIGKYSNKINNNDTMECSLLFNYLGNDRSILLYRNQTGLGANDDNVVAVNFNNEKPLILSVDSIKEFSGLNGYLSYSYLRDVADAYSGINAYYSSENEDLDFSSYVKKRS